MDCDSLGLEPHVDLKVTLIHPVEVFEEADRDPLGERQIKKCEVVVRLVLESKQLVQDQVLGLREGSGLVLARNLLAFKLTSECEVD